MSERKIPNDPITIYGCLLIIANVCVDVLNQSIPSCIFVMYLGLLVFFIFKITAIAVKNFKDNSDLSFFPRTSRDSSGMHDQTINLTFSTPEQAERAFNNIRPYYSGEYFCVFRSANNKVTIIPGPSVDPHDFA